MIHNTEDYPQNIIEGLRIESNDMEDEKYGTGIDLVLPGDLITSEKGYMHGHGTFEENANIYANVVGIVQRTNQLITVAPIRTKYLGEIGDVVIGRVMEIANRRWNVDVESYNYAILTLNSINLPSGEQRRKTEEDELNMRQYYQENDIIVAEVHSLNNDKTVNLHTRSQKYGKLSYGQSVKVYPQLIKKARNHFIELQSGVSLILGHNGVIWLGSNDKGESRIDPIRRETIARIRNCIKILNDEFMDINAENINELYEESNRQNIPVKDLLNRTKYEALSNILKKKLKLKIPQEMKNVIDFTSNNEKGSFLNL